MKKNLLRRINLLLGSLSLMLAGCHIQKQATAPEPVPPEPEAPVVAQPSVEEPIICLYGVPAEF